MHCMWLVILREKHRHSRSEWHGYKLLCDCILKLENRLPQAGHPYSAE